MRRDDSSPEAYRNDIDGPLKLILERVREVIREVAPEIEEAIGHGMLDYPGLANLAAQKDYVALYVTPNVLAKHRDDFSGVSCGKSCLRFRRIEQADRDSLARLLREVRADRSKRKT